tara:strand:+ start:75 stop:743 length:669 start_codon:yes stop_codon:yes gene_type:complete
MNYTKIFFIIIFALIIVFSYIGNLGSIAIDAINFNLDQLKLFKAKNPYILEILYFFIYIIITSLSLPLAFFLGLLAGMIFNVIDAVIIISFASTIGATFSFLISRYLFRDFVIRKFKNQYDIINEGFLNHSNYYILALRMCFIFPFFLVNLVLGITSIKVSNYYLISQLGMLPATIIIVNLGSSVSDSLKTNMPLEYNILILLAILGFLPLISKILLKKYLN